MAQVSLSRFDLFHAHLFATHGGGGGSGSDRQLGLLFHAREYPMNSTAFPHNLGYCQAGSSLAFDARGMDTRNILYIQVRQTEWPHLRPYPA